MDNIIYGDVEKYKSEDYIFHYSKRDTIFDFILKDKRLRFNKIQNMSDVLESKFFKANIAYMVEDEERQTKELINTFELLDIYRKKLQIISFSSNQTFFGNIKYNFNKEILNPTIGKLINSGFLKMRMWDQYADKFSGCCLIFNKNKLENIFENSFSEFNIKKDNIKYSYNVEDIKPQIGTSNPSFKKICEYILTFYNIKNIDYFQESEYRLSVINHISDDYLFLDIEDSVEGIILGPNIKKEEHQYYLNCLKKMDTNIEVFKFEIYDGNSIPIMFNKLK